MLKKILPFRKVCEMANFKIPFTFIAGTKAKAEEVNQNFDAIKVELNNKLDVNNEGYITIKDATEDNQPINKSQFDTSKEEFKSEIVKITQNKELKRNFLFESGNIDSSAQPDLIDTEENTKVVFKVDNGENYKPLRGVLADSTGFELTSIEDLHVGELEDGIYNLFIDKDGNCLPLANRIYRQKTTPIGLVETPFVQPVLTSNGTAGGDSFAVWADNEGEYPAWRAFDGGATPWWSHRTNGMIGFYNPFPLKLEKLSVVNNATTNITTIASGDIYGSNDGTTWTKLAHFTNSNQVGSAKWDILVNSNTAYKYHKLQATSIIGHPSYTNYTIIQELTIKATQVNGENLTNAVWLDTSVKPYVSKKYNGITWNDFKYVPLPQNITIKNGSISSINKIGNYNDNGWDNYVTLPDINRSTILTNGTTFKPTVNGWIANKNGLVKHLFTDETFTPTEDGYIFYAMKGE